MKKNLTIFSLIITCISFSQKEIEINVSGNIFNFKGDSVHVAHYFGTHYKDFLSAPVSKNGDFNLKGKLPANDFYVFKISPNNHINVILRDKSDIKIYGDASNFMSFNNIVNSDESVNLNEFVLFMQAINYQNDSLNNFLQKNPNQRELVSQKMNQLNMEFNAYKQSYIQNNPNSPALLPILSTIDPNSDFVLYENIINQVSNSLEGSTVIEQVKGNFAQLKRQREEADFLAPGKQAPDFVQQKIDGTNMKLSDLKGQVVLLDFWASWCGPCRQENPTVVRLYEKYKKDGFTVMSVSLDRAKEPWLAAIEKDKLTWPNHVSDLKAWQNEAAKLYKVTGIPFTVLLDKEGKIINTKLRGRELEQTLQQIFGY
jgi:thiol-disulfide isomerase/thioredoxin